MEAPRKRGRKPRNLNPDYLLHDNRMIGFVPNRLTREQLVYCMRETGVTSKSGILALAIKNFHDMLVAESRRRQEAEMYDVSTPIGPSTFGPNNNLR